MLFVPVVILIWVNLKKWCHVYNLLKSFNPDFRSVFTSRLFHCVYPTVLDGDLSDRYTVRGTKVLNQSSKVYVFPLSSRGHKVPCMKVICATLKHRLFFFYVKKTKTLASCRHWSLAPKHQSWGRESNNMTVTHRWPARLADSNAYWWSFEPPHCVRVSPAVTCHDHDIVNGYYYYYYSVLHQLQFNPRSWGPTVLYRLLIRHYSTAQVRKHDSRHKFYCDVVTVNTISASWNPWTDWTVSRDPPPAAWHGPWWRNRATWAWKIKTKQTKQCLYSFSCRTCCRKSNKQNDKSERATWWSPNPALISHLTAANKHFWCRTSCLQGTPAVTPKHMFLSGRVQYESVEWWCKKFKKKGEKKDLS